VLTQANSKLADIIAEQEAIFVKRQPKSAALASRFDQQTVALTVVSSVASTYFQALELRDRIEVAQQNLQNGEKILRGFQAEQLAGTATGLDVAQQETTVAVLNAALPPLLQQFRQTVYALAVLIGKTPESVDVDMGTLTDLSSPPVVEGLPSQLLSRRPDVAEAEQQLIAANADITVARAALFPDIQLTAAGGYESSALSSLVNPFSRVYSIGAGLTQGLAGITTLDLGEFLGMLDDQGREPSHQIGTLARGGTPPTTTERAARRAHRGVDLNTGAARHPRENFPRGGIDDDRVDDRRLVAGATGFGRRLRGGRLFFAAGAQVDLRGGCVGGPLVLIVEVGCGSYDHRHHED